MDEYSVEGMSCAACAAHVEKAVRGVDGVDEVSVNLLTNSMRIKGSADPLAVCLAVKNAGYGAAPKGDSQTGKNFKQKNNRLDELADKETPKLLKRLLFLLSLLLCM